MTLLEEEIGKEVYIGGSNVDNFTPMSVFIEKSLFAFKNKIEKIEVDITEELIAAHGILTTALSIPNSIPEDTSIFIILPDADEESNSYILEVESIYLLQKIVEALVDKHVTEKDAENVSDYILNLKNQNIEDIFILYGYNITLSYRIMDTTLEQLVKEKNHACLQSIVRSQI